MAAALGGAAAVGGTGACGRSAGVGGGAGGGDGAGGAGAREFAPGDALAGGAFEVMSRTPVDAYNVVCYELLHKRTGGTCASCAVHVSAHCASWHAPGARRANITISRAAR